MSITITKRTKAFAVAGLTSLVVSALAFGPGSPAAAGNDTYNYTFDFVNGTTLTGTATDKVAFIAGAGGTSVDNPTGMEVHLSCSDKFEGGFGQKDGPNAQSDSAWQIASYSIEKVDKGKVKKTCGDSFTPPEPVGVPSVDIEKTVNGEDADTPTGPRLQVGDTATFAYRVTNDGDVALTEVVVTDETLGAVTCPKTELAVDESMDCSEKTKVITEPGQMGMNSTVTAKGNSAAASIDALAGGVDKGYAYRFTFVNGQTITGSSKDKTAFIPDAGGTSADNPIGMDVHLSCSDKFEGGFGQKDGPEAGRDSAWQIASFEIGKVKDGEIDKRCGTPGGAVPTMVTDDDPVYFFAEEPIDPPDPKIDIEKSVNGYDADDAPGPEFHVGDTVKFHYVVTNTGDTLLTNIMITDSILGPIDCTVPDLGPGGSYGCPKVRKTLTTPGAVFMEGTVTGDSPQGETVTDTDPVNFTVIKDHPPTKVPMIDIEKSVNYHDADEAPGPQFYVGDTVKFHYVVTNTGETLLTNIKVTDSILGDIDCTVPDLGPGGSYGCPKVYKTLTEKGAVFMEGTVTGDSPQGETVTDTDPVNFTVVYYSSIVG